MKLLQKLIKIAICIKNKTLLLLSVLKLNGTKKSELLKICLNINMTLWIIILQKSEQRYHGK